MTRHTRSAFRRGSALAAALTLVTSMVLSAPLAHSQAADATVEISGAEFRWGVNPESGTVGHAPGTYNFLYAGDVSSHLAGPNSQIDSGAWSATAGNVTIQKRNSGGSLRTASWSDVQTDSSGAALKSGARNGLEMLFSGGQGEVNTQDGTASIQWKGTASVVYYSGFVYMTMSNPVLSVSKSSASISAIVGGHKSDRTNPDLWEKITPRKVTVATLKRDCVDLAGEKGFAVSPEYRGVTYAAAPGQTAQKRDGDGWGAFPAEFVNFAADTGSGSFWYSSGGVSDSMKAPLPVSVGWAAGGSGALSESCDSPGTGGGSKGIVGQVIDETIEDIIRSAGIDVADTAAAWMDEAWKPAQPDAVTAAQAGQAAGVQAPAEVGNMVGTAGEAVVDEEFSAHLGEQYSAGAPITAGTVGAAVASSPASGGAATRGGGASGIAAAPAATQAPSSMAANLPLTEVVYSQVASERDAESFQWQWLFGLVLLAAAGALGYLVLRRKA